MPEAPTAPDSLKETGLSLSFLNELMMRTLYTRGAMLGLDLARLLCLPFKVCEEALGFLKHEKCIEVLGGDLIGRIMETSPVGIVVADRNGRITFANPRAESQTAGCNTALLWRTSPRCSATRRFPRGPHCALRYRRSSTRTE